MEAWEEAGFKDEESHNAFVQKQNEAREKAVNDAKAAQKTELEADFEKRKAAAVAEATKPLNDTIETLKQKKGAGEERDTPERREERFGTALDALQSGFGDEQWDAVDEELKKLQKADPELAKRISAVDSDGNPVNKEARYEFLKQVASPESDEPVSLRPKKQEQRKSMAELVAEGILKARGNAPRGLPPKRGTGIRPNAAEVTDDKKPAVPQPLPRTGSLCDVRPG